MEYKSLNYIKYSGRAAGKRAAPLGKIYIRW